MEVQRADPKLRAFVFVGAAAAWAAFSFFLSSSLSAASQLPRSAALNQLHATLAVCLALVCLCVVAMGALLWRTGTSASLHAQIPPPGWRVLRDTQVLRGEAAVRQGRRLRVAGGALFICAFVLAAVFWNLHAKVAASVV